MSEVGKCIPDSNIDFYVLVFIIKYSRRVLIMAEQDKMSREEAGAKGGRKTAREHNKEHFEDIGEKGGNKTAREHGKEHFEDIGKKGGNASSNNNS